MVSNEGRTSSWLCMRFTAAVFKVPPIMPVSTKRNRRRILEHMLPDISGMFAPSSSRKIKGRIAAFSFVIELLTKRPGLDSLPTLNLTISYLYGIL